MEHVTGSLLQFSRAELEALWEETSFEDELLNCKWGSAEQAGRAVATRNSPWIQEICLFWWGKVLPPLPQKQPTVQNMTLQAFPRLHNVSGRERIKKPPSQPLLHLFVQTTVPHCCSLNLAVPAHFNSWKCAPTKSLPVFNSKCRGKSSNSSSTTAEFSIDGK